MDFFAWLIVIGIELSPVVFDRLSAPVVTPFRGRQSNVPLSRCS